MTRREVRQKAATIFLNAATYIRRYGWQEEGIGADKGPRCSMGALQSSYSKISWEDELSTVMYKSLYTELNGLSLTQFNHQKQDGEAVAKLFEQTASKLNNH